MLQGNQSNNHDQGDELSAVFIKLNEYLAQIYESDANDSSSTTASDIVEFKIDRYRWITSLHPISANNEFVREINDTDNDSLPSQCQIICLDIPTFLAVIHGKINPLRALISGKLKLNGDRKLFTRLSGVIKKFRDTFHVHEIENENTSSSSRIHLQVRLLGIETKLRSNSSQKPLILYKLGISVKLDDGTTTSPKEWTITRRFNDFKELRAIFVDIDKQKNWSSSNKPYVSISYPLDNFTMWTELAVLRRQRLQDFIHDILSRPELMQHRETKHVLEAFFDIRSHLQTGMNPTFEVEDSRWKDIASPIPCRSGSFDVTSIFLRETLSMKSRLQDNNYGKQNLLQVLFPLVISIIWNICIFGLMLVTVLIMLQGYHFSDADSLAVMKSLVDYIQLFVMNDEGTSLSLIQIPIVDITWLSATATATSLAVIIHPMTRIPAMSAAVTAIVISIQQIDLAAFSSAISHALMRMTPLIARRLADVLVALAILPTSKLVFIVMLSLSLIYSLVKFQRLIHVYALGSSLISLYLSLKITCKLLRLSDASQKILYDFVDSIVAPLVMLQIRSLKSLFIKFAQYFGGRSDMITPVWCNALSLLQDACDASSADYVRQAIYESFHASVEDIFESFDWTPIASASIGQVHLATLRQQSNTRNSETTSISSSSQHQETSSELNISSSKIDVVVKVQHHNIAALMHSDVNAVLLMMRFVARFDDRWKLSVQVLESWKRTMHEELNFMQEATNLVDVADGLVKGGIPVLMPQPIRGLCAERVMVMTRLHGFKVTEHLALQACSIDKYSLVNRIAHSAAHQLLVIGIFNGDPHAGNLFVCPSPTKDAECLPGLLDFGMTVRISKKQRHAYCKLFIGLAEGDIDGVSDALSEIGYATNQRARAPERDAEFFLYLFRNATSRDQSPEESKEFMAHRESQRKEDFSSGQREKGGRQIAELPEEFLFLTRVIGLLRGLTAELDVDCPILQILAYHAELGLK
jgi:predicted unusual protein kinase regulating ubiquinone biosynthesis (AarF/ABC1/UbiB family)